MKTIFLTTLIAMALVGCSSKKTPTWLIDSESYIEKFKIAKLGKADKEANIYKQKASAAVKQSANIGLLQVIELTDAAMDIATLKEANFTSYERLSKIEHNASNEAYKQMLTAGKPNISTLPPVYTNFAASLSRNDAKKAFEDTKEIKNDISRLIALGILAKLEPQNKAIYEDILAISKSNGYKGVTIAAMSRLQAIYVKEGDKEGAAKMLLVLEELKR